MPSVKQVIILKYPVGLYLVCISSFFLQTMQLSVIGKITERIDRRYRL